MELSILQKEAKMTPASFSNTESANNIITKNMITPPEGWHVAEEESVDASGDNLDMKVLKDNLQIVGRETLELIEKIQNEAEIHVPEAYLRVEKENIFHLLLLISQEDFLSPKIIEAKIVAENYVKNEVRFDVRISFGNNEENTHKNVLSENGYKLKHLAIA